MRGKISTTRLMYFHLLFITIWFLFIPSIVFTQNFQTEQSNRLVDIELTSSFQYDHPHRDVQIECELLGPNGEGFRISGFWDGQLTYRVRFALPETGEWRYRTVCGDVTNTGLHNITGSILVSKYDGTNPLYAKGWPEVSDDGHYLTHANGDPFFYLADTAWEITWKSHKSQFLNYLADRKKKGFTAIQLVAMTHQNFSFESYGVRNREGETFFVNEDYSLLIFICLNVRLKL